jgi:hypothetical protein
MMGVQQSRLEEVMTKPEMKDCVMPPFHVGYEWSESKQSKTHASKRKSCSCVQPGMLSRFSFIRYNTLEKESITFASCSDCLPVNKERYAEQFSSTSARNKKRCLPGLEDSAKKRVN